NLGFFACIGYVMLHAFTGVAVLGNITLFLVIFPQIFNVLQNLSSNISTLYQNNIFVASIFELFDLEQPAYPENSRKPLPSDKAIDIELKQVNFTYPNTTRPVLTDINLKIPSGKIIAVVGLNGAGKTTLIKLLCRLYDPVTGSI